MAERVLEDEEVRRQIGRAEVIAKVAGGVVHNFNNILAVLLGRVELMLGQVDSGRVDVVQLRRGLLSVQQVTKDAAELLKRLRDLTQPPQPQPMVTFDLSRVVLDAMEFIQPHVAAVSHTLGVTITVTPRLSGDPIPVSGQASGLREVLVNLLLNAVEAMPAGGTITLETRRDGTRAVVRVADTGIGMSDEVRERAFTPFFTTKGAANTGIGLSSAKELVTRHGGAIFAQSTPGAGTVFTIALPVAEELVAIEGATVVSAIPPGLNVLIAEDEPALGAVLEEFLRACGCRVTTVGGGAAAVEELGRRRFDVVLADLLLPVVGLRVL
jgi:two-component system cell cycle sensor histidine kinase/response regulator CckA